MSKHTPGPWIASNVNTPDEDLHTAVWQYDGSDDYYQRTSQVCECHYTDDNERDEWRPVSVIEAQANAKLIAAAPGMYEALKKIRDARDYCADHGTYPPDSVTSGQAFDDWAADLVDTALRGLD